MPYFTKDDKEAGHIKRALYHHVYKPAANQVKLDDRGRVIADTKSCIDPFFYYPTIQELITRFAHTQKGEFHYDDSSEEFDDHEDDLPEVGLSPYEETPSGLSLKALQGHLQRKKAPKAATPPASIPAEPDASVDASS